MSYRITRRFEPLWSDPDHEIVKCLKRAPFSQFDLGILEGPVDQTGAGIQRLEFECSCVLSEHHPLASHEILTPEHLDGVPFASLYQGHMTYGQIASAFKDAGAHWNVIAEAQYFASCCSFASLGECVSIVHPVTAYFYRDRGLVERRFQPPIVYELYLVLPPQRPRSVVVLEFVDLLKRRIGPYLRRNAGARAGAGC